MLAVHDMPVYDRTGHPRFSVNPREKRRDVTSPREGVGQVLSDDKDQTSRGPSLPLLCALLLERSSPGLIFAEAYLLPAA